MARVLERGLRLLEALAAIPGMASVQDLAVHSRLPPATCTRLLHHLVADGWVEQPLPRGPYRLGHRLHALAQARPFRAALIAAGQPVIARLARATRSQVMLVVRHEHRRILLASAGDGPARPTKPYEVAQDCWYGASGFALIAAAGPALRRRLWQCAPTPCRWPGVVTWRDLQEACREANACGWVEHHPRDVALSAVGVALPDGEGGHAAIGLLVARDRWHAGLIAAAVRAGADIARRLEKKRGGDGVDRRQ
jgi:DNA-binding IclR family transcriptional regulator